MYDEEFDEVEAGCLDATMLPPAGSMVQHEVREDCTDENGNDTGYFRVVGYEAEQRVILRYGFGMFW